VNRSADGYRQDIQANDGLVCTGVVCAVNKRGADV